MNVEVENILFKEIFEGKQLKKIPERKERRSKMMERKGKKIGIVDCFAMGCGAIPSIVATYMLSAFVTVYFTDIAHVSAGVIGSVILLMRITDGVSDLIMGRIIDLTRSRMGKARPWLCLGTIGVAVTLLLIFRVPQSFSTEGKVGYFAVVYFLLMVVFVTMAGIALTTLIAFLTNKAKERSKLGASQMAGTYIGGIIATTVTSMLLVKWGYSQEAYDKTMAIYAVFILVTGLFAFFKLREDKGITAVANEKEKVPVRLALVSMVKNKYYMYAVIAGMLINLVNGIYTGLGVYYCRDLFGDAGMYTFVTLAMLLPILLGMPFAVAVSNKLGRYKTLAYGRVGYLFFMIVAAAGIMLVHIPLYFAGLIGAGIFGASFGACFTATVADTCDYSEYISGVKATGMLLSATSFCNKVGLGLGSAITGVILVLAKYDGSLSQQSEYTIRFEQAAVAFIPVVLTAIVTLCLFRCNIDKEMKVVRAELEKRHGVSVEVEK
ncbi:MFS transporter [Lachnospiraceae bacterium OttesenSCG-928-D06]|nr:MFS transporter [Lachnospiraceae bacterium OttesenSCG-928-D06]